MITQFKIGHPPSVLEDNKETKGTNLLLTEYWRGRADIWPSQRMPQDGRGYENTKWKYKDDGKTGQIVHEKTSGTVFVTSYDYTMDICIPKYVTRYTSAKSAWFTSY